MAPHQLSGSSRPFERGQLSILWLGWLAVVVAAMSAWAIGAVANYDALAHPPASAEPALRDAMMTARGHAIYHLVLDAVFIAAAVSVSALVLKRNQGDRVAKSAAFVLAAWAPLNGFAAESAMEGPWWLRASVAVAWGSWVWLATVSFRAHSISGSLLTRQPIHWLWYGAAATLVVTAFVAIAIGSGATLASHQVDRHMTAHLLFFIAGCAVVAGIFIAWVRDTVTDPDTLIQRTLVHGSLTAIVAAMTTAIVFLPAFFYYELGPVYLLTVVCIWAVLGLSVREWVQRMVSRMMYGQRDEPMTVLTTLGERLELGSPETVLHTIAETVASALKLPAVVIRSSPGGETLAAVGHLELEPFVVPVIYQGEVVGQVVATPRALDEDLHLQDREILRLVAQQAGPTVRAVQLNQELRSSRLEILLSREEERRRIRRDLHDGLGPQLAAIAMQADTAREIVLGDPAAARDLLVAVISQTEEVVQEVRRLVYDLRPPALDQFGLLGAIEILTQQHAHGELRIDVKGPPALPTLAAAVEVAVYRIVSEALTNVARHAHARQCDVNFVVRDGELSVSVMDDGVGISKGATHGIGLGSMRARASEVGGDIEIRERTGGGTEVTLTVPVQLAAPPSVDGLPGRVEANDG